MACQPMLNHTMENTITPRAVKLLPNHSMAMEPRPTALSTALNGPS